MAKKKPKRKRDILFYVETYRGIYKVENNKITKIEGGRRSIGIRAEPLQEGNGGEQRS